MVLKLPASVEMRRQAQGFSQVAGDGRWHVRAGPTLPSTHGRGLQEPLGAAPLWWKVVFTSR